MLNNIGFDVWSSSYDESVKMANDNNLFPFAGYANVMNSIYTTIMNYSPANILDIGFGTALLTAKLYETGNIITGFDFSREMVDIARRKMPNANLLQWDFTKGFPVCLANQKYDFVVSTYALHHLTDEDKITFIGELLDQINPQGAVLIGDVCFDTESELQECKRECKDEWDHDEHYFVISDLKRQLEQACTLTYHKYSFCSGVIEIRKANTEAHK